MYYESSHYKNQIAANAPKAAPQNVAYDAYDYSDSMNLPSKLTNSGSSISMRFLVSPIALALLLLTSPIFAQGKSKDQAKSPAVVPTIVGYPIAADYGVLRQKAEALQLKSCNGHYRYLDRPTSVANFVGGLAKDIRIVRFSPKGNGPSNEELGNTVGNIWLGEFKSASCQIDWAEGALWSIEAVVEFYDGTTGKIVSDGGHVAFQDHDGNSWFVRLLPAAQ
jgi:hypothetical protein